MSSLKFGTSGLRGLVTELPDEVCFDYASAFLSWMSKAYGFPSNVTLLVGYDLRDSSVRIAGACMMAAHAAGVRVENCGALPTPALAFRAQSIGAPAIMVTGSHIPADRNGLKFYRPDGEIDKSDEAGILSLLQNAAFSKVMPAHPTISSQALDAYQARCIAILPAQMLRGMRIGVYQHSSVGRDFLTGLLDTLGADTVVLGRSDVFVPVDTEALRPEDVAFAHDAAQDYNLDALVSTDGDADRPLVADENGTFFRGDLLGILSAQYLGSDCVVTPVTSSSIVESCGYFSNIVRTRVGSPFVIEGMSGAAQGGARIIVGFEANGGVLLGSDVLLDGKILAALPTRDAMLPILCVLGLAARTKTKLSNLTNSLPPRFNQSGRLEHVEQTATKALLMQLLNGAFRNHYFAGISEVVSYDAIDGMRFVLANGDVLHYRASGNAPELRCYTEASSAQSALALLNWGLDAAKIAVL